MKSIYSITGFALAVFSALATAEEKWDGHKDGNAAGTMGDNKILWGDTPLGGP